jgi:hypothetical protein
LANISATYSYCTNRELADAINAALVRWMRLKKNLPPQLLPLWQRLGMLVVKDGKQEVTSTPNQDTR